MPIRYASLLSIGIVALSVGSTVTPLAAAEETIRVATWNIANLHHVVGEPGEIDDGDPAGLDLWRLPSGEESDCWRGTSRHFPQPIDFLVFDDRAWLQVAHSTFREITWDSEDQDVARATPSDHCPKAVEMRF